MFSLDEDALLDLRHPVADQLLEWRWRKMATQFLEQIRDMAGTSIDGRIHANVNQLVRTGRASLTEPNLHQMPVDKDYGVRDLFVAPLDMNLWLPDYDQLQLRLAAKLTGDANMIRVFGAGGDIHANTLVKMKKENPDAVRRDAKVVNFSVVFGTGNDGLARSLRASGYKAATPAIAEAFKAALNSSYPAVKKKYWKMKTDAETDPVVTVESGRRRFLIKGRERTAFNTAIQMMEADITKAGLVKIGPVVRALGGHITNWVHDEFHVALPKEVSESEVWKLVELCEDRTGAVPITVSLALAAPSWGAKKETTRDGTGSGGSPSGNGGAGGPGGGAPEGGGEVRVHGEEPSTGGAGADVQAPRQAGEDAMGGAAGGSWLDGLAHGEAAGVDRGADAATDTAAPPAAPDPRWDGWDLDRLDAERAVAIIRRPDGSFVAIGPVAARHKAPKGVLWFDTAWCRKKLRERRAA